MATVFAYVALAGYDRLALSHLHKKVSWTFISVASFTAYAIGHNLGASVFSGAVVRYRAYRSQGLTAGEVGILVAFCSFTFALGTILLGGVVLLVEPSLPAHFHSALPEWVAVLLGVGMLSLVALYLWGSFMKRRCIDLWKLKLEYPRFSLICRQLVVAPLELLAAAAIIYYALPEQSNPGYFMVLGILPRIFLCGLVVACAWRLRCAGSDVFAGFTRCQSGRCDCCFIGIPLVLSADPFCTITDYCGVV